MLFSILANGCAWAAIQMALVLLANCVRPRQCDVSAPHWERNGRFYRRLGVRSWKHLLPDGGDWFSGGFSKRHLHGRGVAELKRFACETRRGELVHWCAIGALPLFRLWNGWPGMLINLGYALAANLPCIIVLRYNRARIARLLQRSTEPNLLAETSSQQH